MIEIFFVIMLARIIGAKLRAKGRNPGWYQFLLVIFWFVGQVVGLVIGLVIYAGNMSLGIYVLGLAGAGLGAKIAFWIVARATDGDQVRTEVGRVSADRLSSDTVQGQNNAEYHREAPFRRDDRKKFKWTRKTLIRFALLLSWVPLLFVWLLLGGMERTVLFLSWFSEPIDICRQFTPTDSVFSCASCLRDNMNYLNVRSGECIELLPGQESGEVLNSCPPQRSFSIVPQVCK